MSSKGTVVRGATRRVEKGVAGGGGCTHRLCAPGCAAYYCTLQVALQGPTTGDNAGEADSTHSHSQQSGQGWQYWVRVALALELRSSAVAAYRGTARLS